jgi:hypothetical protein
LAPSASEAVKFNGLSYFHDDAPYRSIGGNICVIEIRDAKVTGFPRRRIASTSKTSNARSA